MKMTHPATLRLAYLQRLATLLGKPFIRPQGQTHLLDLIMATMYGALRTAACKELYVHFITSITQGSYYLHPHSTDEESEA